MHLDTTKKIDRTNNSYCGPLVIAALLGRSTKEAALLVRMRTGKNVVKGMSADHIAATLRPHGLHLKHERLTKTSRTYRLPPPKHCAWASVRDGKVTKSVGPTFAQWLRSREHANQTHLVDVGKHWVLVHGRKMVDTYTDGEWLFIRKAPHRRRRVCNVWRIFTDSALNGERR